MGWKDSAIPVTEDVPEWKKNAIPVEHASAEPSSLDKQVPYIGGTPRGYIKGGLNALPLVGAAGGGLVGAAGGGPIGGVGGAALGGGAGEGLKSLGEQYILGEEKKPGDYIKPEAEGLVRGAGQEVGGQILSKAAKVVGDVPGLLKELSKAPEGESVVFDPFLKTNRVPGQSIEELKNIGTEINQVPKSGESGLLQKSAGMASNAIEGAGPKLEKAGNFAYKSIPHVTEAVGSIFGLPGYAVGRSAGKALTSAPAREAAGAGARIIKDAAGNIVVSPQGLGLLINEAREQK